MGQVLMHLEQHGWNRQTDISLVMLVIVVPLMLVLPLIVPWRNSEGSWIGALIEKATHFFFYHMNYYTAILLCFTVWFVYHVDINDDPMTSLSRLSRPTTKRARLMPRCSSTP